MKTRLILDINKTQYAQLNSLVTGRVGDKASNTVDVYVVDGFIPYNLTGSDVYFECAKPDNTSVRDKNGITMIDAAKGHFEYTFPTQTFASVGKSKQAYFTVEKNATIKATTQDFIIISLPDALTNRIPSKTYISQLDQLIKQLEQMQLDVLNSEAYKEAHDAKEFAEQAKMISESVQEQLNQIVINGSIDPETKQARVDAEGKVHPNLKARIDSDSVKLESLIKKTDFEISIEQYSHHAIRDNGGKIIDWQPAIMKAISDSPEGTTIKFSGKDYNIAQNINVGNKSLYLKGTGKKTRFVLNSTALTEPLLKIGYTSNEGNKVPLTANANKGDDTITVSSTTNIRTGDYLLIVSDEPFSAAPDKANRYKGEILRVRSTTTTTIEFYSRLQDNYNSATGGGYKKISIVDGFCIEKISFYNPNPNQTLTPFLSVNNTANVVIRDIHMKNGDEYGCGFNNVVGGVIDNLVCEDFINNETSLRYGYGINIFRATQNISVSNCHFKRCRHGFTVDNEVNNYGVPRHIVVSNCTSVDGSQANFDTHQCGEFITFVNCSVQGAKVGSDPYGGTYKDSIGFQIRSQNTRLIGCEVNGSDDGIWIDTFANGININNCRIVDVKGVGIYIKENFTSSNGNVKDVVIQGTTIINSGDHGILVNASSKNITIQGCFLDGASKVSSGKHGIYVGSNVNVVRISNNIIVDTSATPTTRYGIYLASGATNCYVLMNYINNMVTGRVQNLGTSNFITELDNNGNLVTPNIFINGYLQLGKVASLPAASSIYRGYKVRVEGGSGVADKEYICMKTAADTYIWVQATTG
ncbi:BppU family phage baseplate upper protein [Bacillus sp. RC252]|uniref:BppU family phage baseplate upper protein n=1 Tax=Bacillus sp. RC252 TaxID=3156289 RepID=UPI0038369F3C